MRNATAILFCAGLLASAGQAGFADTAMMPAMPKCAAGDPVVGVNPATKMYMTQAQMQAKSAGLTPAQKQAMMQKSHVKLMCKSQADAMGAKMMKT